MKLFQIIVPACSLLEKISIQVKLFSQLNIFWKLSKTMTNYSFFGLHGLRSQITPCLYYEFVEIQAESECLIANHCKNFPTLNYTPKKTKPCDMNLVRIQWLRKVSSKNEVWTWMENLLKLDANPPTPSIDRIVEYFELSP